jgi:hypothetical protein
MDIVVFYWRLVKRSLAIEGRTPPWQGYGVTLPGGFAEYIRVRAVDAEPMPPPYRSAGRHSSSRCPVCYTPWTGWAPCGPAIRYWLSEPDRPV